MVKMVAAAAIKSVQAKEFADGRPNYMWGEDVGMEKKENEEKAGRQ